ncbi:MAG TPA: nickel ABC transporter permease [bacterium]|nr:nickel ABC transporter permease [bacterium]
MIRYLIKRVVLLIPILFAVSTLVFSLIHLVPGDPVDLILGEQSLPADREKMREAMGLNKPVMEQYKDFLSGVVRGDLGKSLFEKRPVSTMILERYPATLELAALAMAVALALSLSFGSLAAVKRGSVWDHGSMLAGLVGISLPGFLLGPLLVLIFAVKLDWLPVAGRQEAGSVVLPALTLGAGMAALLTRLTRSTMLETLREDYVRTARAKGVAEKTVILKHALRNALNPVVTVAGLQFGVLLAGAIVTEKVFAWPGLGSLLVQGIERRDYPVVQGCILCIAASYTLVNLLTDVLYARLDPRIRIEAAE